MDNDGDGLADHDDAQCSEPADGGGAGIDDPAQAKALVTCAKSIRAAGSKLAAAELGQLQRCLATVTKCVQTKPGDAACLVKAGAACTTAGAKITAAKAAFGPAFSKKCGVPTLGAGALLDASGLAYDAEAATCAYYGVPGLGSIADVASCLASRHSCAAERLVGLQYPRARELLGLAGVDASAYPCLATTGDGGGAGVAEPTGAAAATKCAKTLGRAGASFVKSRLNLLRRCATSVLTCVQLKNGDEACLAKAEATCAGALAKLPTLPTKLHATIAKSCSPPLVDVATLLADDGLGLGANAEACAARGVPALGTIGDVATCLQRQHQCEADQLLKNEIPRIYELFGLANASVE